MMAVILPLSIPTTPSLTRNLVKSFARFMRSPGTQKYPWDSGDKCRCYNGVQCLMLWGGRVDPYVADISDAKIYSKAAIPVCESDWCETNPDNCNCFTGQRWSTNEYVFHGSNSKVANMLVWNTMSPISRHDICACPEIIPVIVSRTLIVWQDGVTRFAQEQRIRPLEKCTQKASMNAWETTVTTTLMHGSAFYGPKI